MNDTRRFRGTFRVAVVAVVVVVVCAACLPAATARERRGLRPPFTGTATVGFAYRSQPLRSAEACAPIIAYYGDCMYHPYPAIDFRLPAGTPVRAMEAGFVVMRDEEVDGEGDPTAAAETAYPRRPGKFVVIDHRRARPGYRPPQYSRYSHLSRFSRAVIGQWVRKGTIIGFVGVTQASRAHVHVDFFRGLVDFGPTGGFNEYAYQSGYGAMCWIDSAGRRHRGTKWSIHRGQRVDVARGCRR